MLPRGLEIIGTSHSRSGDDGGDKTDSSGDREGFCLSVGRRSPSTPSPPPSHCNKFVLSKEMLEQCPLHTPTQIPDQPIAFPASQIALAQFQDRVLQYSILCVPDHRFSSARTGDASPLFLRSPPMRWSPTVHQALSTAGRTASSLIRAHKLHLFRRFRPPTPLQRVSCPSPLPKSLNPAQSSLSSPLQPVRCLSTLRKPSDTTQNSLPMQWLIPHAQKYLEHRRHCSARLRSLYTEPKRSDSARSVISRRAEKCEIAACQYLQRRTLTSGKRHQS